MSDAAIATIVTGAVTIVGMIVGWLTLWIKLHHAGSKAEEAATKAAVVEQKIDANTVTTNSVEAKADTIVQQTDGALEHTRVLVKQISERVSKLEDYNHSSTHRTLDSLNAINLKIERLLVEQESRAAQEVRVIADLAARPPAEPK